MNFNELKEYLDEKVDQYNQKSFIEEDSINIPHRFTKSEDIEIAGFLTATIAWGNRKSILKSAEKMLNIMEYSPHQFILNFTEKDIQFVKNINIHRTFNGEDFIYFLKCLKKVYQNQKSLEELFIILPDEKNYFHALHRFRTTFLGSEKHRSHKHVSSTYKNSSAKRLMMFLRWMVRKDNRGVDFGIWQKLPAAYLSIPLDVHTGNIGRKLGIISRPQNDWKTVEELDLFVRKLDPLDPAKYDFALFGVGVNKDF